MQREAALLVLEIEQRALVGRGGPSLHTIGRHLAWDARRSWPRRWYRVPSGTEPSPGPRFLVTPVNSAVFTTQQGSSGSRPTPAACRARWAPYRRGRAETAGTRRS